MLRAPLVSDSGLACAECGLLLSGARFSWLTPKLLGHRRHLLLLKVGQVPMLPSRRCSVLGKEMGCCLAHCFPLNHAEAIFLVDFDPGQLRVQGSRGPLAAAELVEDGEGFGTTLRSNSELSHCCRESCNFAFAERKEPLRDVFPQEFSSLDGPDLFRVDSLLVT